MHRFVSPSKRVIERRNKKGILARDALCAFHLYEPFKVRWFRLLKVAFRQQTGLSSLCWKEQS